MRLAGAQAIELRECIAQRGALSVANPACERATASLDPAEVGLRVALELDGRRVEREVGSVDDAVLALESWLPPPAKAADSPEDQKPAVTVERRSPAPTNDAAARPPVPRPTEEHWPVLAEGTAGVNTSLGGDGSIWWGGELGGALVLRRSLWFGAAIGALADPAFFARASSAGEGIHRSLLRASIRGGARFPLGTRALLDLGLGAGLGSALVVREGTGPRLANDAAPAFVEASALAGYRATRSVRLLAALSIGKLLSFQGEESGTDADDLLDASLPPPYPSWLFGVSLGVTYSGELD